MNSFFLNFKFSSCHCFFVKCYFTFVCFFVIICDSTVTSFDDLIKYIHIQNKEQLCKMIWKWNYLFVKQLNSKIRTCDFSLWSHQKIYHLEVIFCFLSIHFHVSMKINWKQTISVFSLFGDIIFNGCWRLIFIFPCKFNFGFDSMWYLF